MQASERDDFGEADLGHAQSDNPADDPDILWYGKMTPGRDDVVFVAANLDPFARHATLVDVPLAELGIAPDAPYRMHELLTDATYEWRGPRGYVELDPRSAPAQIFWLEL